MSQVTINVHYVDHGDRISLYFYGRHIAASPHEPIALRAGGFGPRDKQIHEDVRAALREIMEDEDVSHVEILAQRLHLYMADPGTADEAMAQYIRVTLASMLSRQDYEYQFMLRPVTVGEIDDDPFDDTIYESTRRDPYDQLRAPQPMDSNFGYERTRL